MVVRKQTQALANKNVPSYIFSFSGKVPILQRVIEHAYVRLILEK